MKPARSIFWVDSCTLEGLRPSIEEARRVLHCEAQPLAAYPLVLDPPAYKAALEATVMRILQEDGPDEAGVDSAAAVEAEGSGDEMGVPGAAATAEEEAAGAGQLED